MEPGLILPAATSPLPPAIYAAMLSVMADVGVIPKATRNQQQGFMFRGIEAAMQAIHPAFVKHRVFLTPEVLEHRETEIQSKAGASGWRVVLKMRFTFTASDGSSVAAVTHGEAMDYADKATNKAMSVALKYALFQVFMIPTEETANMDTDNYSPESVSRTYPSDEPLDNVGKGGGKKAAPKPSTGSITDPQRKAIYAKTKAIGMDDEDRAVLLDKYGVTASTELSRSQASEILDMLAQREKTS